MINKGVRNVCWWRFCRIYVIQIFGVKKTVEILFVTASQDGTFAAGCSRRRGDFKDFWNSSWRNVMRRPVGL